METQDNESSKGWPLGLDIIDMRLRVTETLQASALRVPSRSFSSFSSSNLDTESTASFFQDHSVSLGRLIGIKPRERGVYLPSRVHIEEGEIISVRAVRSEVGRGKREAGVSQGICIPLLVSTLEKMNPNKSKSRQ